jgi:hypothetical protein
LDVTPFILLEVHHLVEEMVASIFRVQEYAVWKKTAGFFPVLYQHLACFKHDLFVLSFIPLDPATSSSVQHPFVTCFPGLRPCCAYIDTNTTAPIHPF